jgi:hypothetical protein
MISLGERARTLDRIAMRTHSRTPSLSFEEYMKQALEIKERSGIINPYHYGKGKPAGYTWLACENTNRRAVDDTQPTVSGRRRSPTTSTVVNKFLHQL